MREPWTDPLTTRERLILFEDRVRYRLYRLRTESVPRLIARCLPASVRKWVLVDAAAKAWATAKTVEPDQVNYPMMYDALEKRP